MTVPAFAWLLLSALFFAGGEYLSKKWGMHPNWPATFLVVGVYALGTFAWLPALLHKNQLAVMGTLWLLLATAATVAVGLLVFGEKLNNFQTAGIVLSAVAMVLLSL